MPTTIAAVVPGHCRRITAAGEACTNTIAVTNATGWCHKCHGKRRPTDKSRSTNKARRSSIVAAAAATSGATPHTTTPPKGTGHLVEATEVGRCEMDVAEYRSGATTGNKTRCKMACLAPETTCYRHGGALTHSFGDITYARALAQAGRGELRVADAAVWSTDEMHTVVASEALVGLLTTDTTALISRFIATASFDTEHGTGRFRGSNPMLLAYSWTRHGTALGLDGDDLTDYVCGRLSEPHHTAAGWAKLGRLVDSDAPRALVIAMATYPRVPRHKGESDIAHEARIEAALLATDSTLVAGSIEMRDAIRGVKVGTRTTITNLAEYTESNTTETPAEASKAPADKTYQGRTTDPLTGALPPGHGDTDAAYTSVVSFLVSHDISVRHVTGVGGGAAASYTPATRTVRLGPFENRTSELASLLHEAGHALAGHTGHAQGTSSDPAAEVEAELFAATTLRWLGCSSPEATQVSAFYVQGYARRINRTAAAGCAARVGELFGSFVTSLAPRT